MKLLEKLKNWRSNNNRRPQEDQATVQPDAVEEIDSTIIDARERIEKMREELGI